MRTEPASSSGWFISRLRTESSLRSAHAIFPNHLATRPLAYANWPHPEGTANTEVSQCVGAAAPSSAAWKAHCG